MSPLLRTVLWFMAVAPLACTVSEVRLSPTLRDTSWLEPGVTTREQVVRRLGDPTSTEKLLTEELLWYRTSSNPLQPSYIPAIIPTPHGPATVTPGPPPGSLETKSDRQATLWIRLDDQGVVRTFGFGDPAGY